jgi:hypothetical protein
MKQNVAALAVTFVLVASCLLMVAPVQAEVSKPSVPEFSVKYFDNSYDIPPSYTTDPYTGGNVSTNGSGEHIDDRYVVFTIKNQPFTAYTDASGNNINLYYNFRFKGHYGGDWVYYPFNGTMTTHSYGIYSGGFFKYYPASTEGNTIISIKLSTLTAHSAWTNIPSEGMVYFEVQTQVGHIDAIHSGMLAGDFYKFTGQASEWSNIQTVTIGNPTTATITNRPTITETPAQTSTTTPSNIQNSLLVSFSWEITAIVGLMVAVAVLAVGMVVMWHKLSPRNKV